MYRLAIVLSLALVACGKSKKMKPGAKCIEATANMLRVPLTAQGRDLSKLSASKSTYLAEIAMAFSEHCENDKWSREAIECFAGAETPDNVGACKDTLTDVQQAAMSGATADVESGAFHRRREAKIEAELAADHKVKDAAKLDKEIAGTRDTLAKLVAVIPAWKHANKDRKDCPMHASSFKDETRTFTDITENKPNPYESVVTVDDWGNQIQVRCGKDVPAGVELGFLSAGPDRDFDTADDVKSW